MNAERDKLVKRIFPQLRKLCEERRVTWGEVDLRWGVTDEQKAEGKILPICLEEIKRCRPYFIGLLGERYGWIPDAIPQELIDREPWLAEHLDHSVTEMEILHGVMRLGLESRGGVKRRYKNITQKVTRYDKMDHFKRRKWEPREWSDDTEQMLCILDSLSENKAVNTKIKGFRYRPARAKEGSLTIVGDWFVAESMVPRPEGYRQTVFTWHAPTVLRWVQKFDQEFKELCEMSNLKHKVSCEAAIEGIEKIIRGLSPKRSDKKP
jgi:hypothetical protein